LGPKANVWVGILDWQRSEKSVDFEKMRENRHKPGNSLAVLHAGLGNLEALALLGQKLGQQTADPAALAKEQVHLKDKRQDHTQR
jgi:hypothetical protein